MIKHSLMKRILTALFLVISVSLFAQVRDYTSAEISTVHSTNAAAAGDLYNDTQAGILYIGLMDGTLVPIQNTDTQDILQFEFDVSNNKVYIELQNGGLDTIDLTLLNDPGDDNQDLILGTRAGTNQDIDIQRGTGITIDVADNDNDSSNEFQDLSAGTVTATTREVVISDGTNATINIEDADSDASNEFQDLSTGTVTATTREVVISDGTNTTINIEDADSDASNEFQDLSAGTVTATTREVIISDGTNATINIEDADSDASNEFQDLSAGSTTATTREVVISDGTNATINIEDADSDASNELQTISKTGDTVTLSDGGGSFSDDHLGTSDQTLSSVRSVDLNANSLTFTGSTNNVLIQSDGDVGIGVTPDESFHVGDNMRLDGAFEDKDGEKGTSGQVLSTTATGTDWITLPADIDTDDQDLGVGTTTATTREITITDGTNATINIEDADSDASNEFQDLSAGTVTATTREVVISDGTNATINIEDADSDASNEFQDLSAGSTTATTREIVISDGTNATINIEDADSDASNELQTISKTGDTVTLSDGGGSFSDDHLGTSDQTLSSVRSVDLNANSLTFTGSTNNVLIQSDGDVGIGVTPDESFHVGDNMRLDGAFEDKDGEKGTSGQVLSTTATGTDWITLPADIDTDDQDLGVGTTTATTREITITDGTNTTINIEDADSDASNEFQDLSAGTVTATTREVVISDGTNATINIEDADSDASNEFQDLSTGTVTATTREVVISDGTNATINIEDADSDASNELQTISKTGDTVTLSDGGGSFADDHLGTSNQTLNAQRTVILNSNDLIFDGSADDVVIASDGDVGIGTLTPAARLDVDDGTVKFSDYGIGNVLDTLTASAHPHSAFHLGVMPNGDVVEVNTVKSAKIFYPPAIVIDVSTITDGADPDLQIDLYDEYFTRFNTPVLSSPSSAGSIPTYDRSELEYHVTDYDTSVFGTVALDDNGNFSYRVIAVPVGGCTFINVVFVVK